MIGISLDRPEMLLGLLLVPLAVWLALRSDRLGPHRRKWSAALRAVVLTVLVLALAGPRVEAPSESLAVAFLLDASDSVPPEEVARSQDFVRQALGDLSAGDRAAVIVFGARPLVERVASAGPLETIRSVSEPGRTDVGAAVRLGLAVLPADSARRLVLLSDGRSNTGDLERQTDLAAASGVPVDIVPLAAAASSEEVTMRSLEAPTNARVGARYELQATVHAGSEVGAKLQIFSDREVLLDERVVLVPGDNRFKVAVTATEPGFERYRAVVSPDRDGRSENNEAGAYTLVAGSPKVLVVASEARRADAVMRALETAERRAVRVTPSAVPDTLLGLSGYDAVVLVDVPARDLSRSTMLALEAFVRDLGHGLVMVGGEDSFGAGGYRHTPIERALPVDMEVRDKENRPDVAIAFVLDRSGSMAESSRPGVNKLDLAKEAVMQAGMLLRAEDSAAVVAFDDRAYQVWPMSLVDDPRGFEETVSGIGVGGGTNIQSGVAAGIAELAETEAPIKHMILLSDGWSDEGGYDELLWRMDDLGVTLSIVAVGEGSAPFLKELAEQGGGRYYPVVDPADVPQVFVEDTMTALGTYVVEERFQPAPGAASEILAGMDTASLRPLDGYNGTTAKQSARVALWSHLDDPVLAQWQYGLGRSVAWTSDLKPQWASEWVAAADFAPFVVQLIDWTLPAPDDEGLSVAVRTEGGTVHITLHAADEDGTSVDFLQVDASLSGPDGEGVVVPLEQTAVGVYEGSAELAAEGTYLVRVVAREGGEIVGARTLGLVMPYGAEYADPADRPTDPRLYALATATGGRVISEPRSSFDAVSGFTRTTSAWPWLMLLAVLVFPFDVGVRRLKLTLSDVSAAARGSHVAEVLEADEGDTLSRLRKAKERARKNR